MNFPRIGLIRNRADDRVLAVWNYCTQDGVLDVIENDCPWADFTPGQHEVVNLSGVTRDEHRQIAERHHETVIERGPGNSGWALSKKDADGNKTPHPIAAIDDDGKVKKESPGPPGNEE